MKRFVILMLVLFLTSTVHANIPKTNIGLDLVIAKQDLILERDNQPGINFNDDLNVNRDTSLCEVYGSANSRNFSARGYYLFPKKLSGSGKLLPGQYDSPDPEKNKKEIAATAENSFKASRLEIGVPISYRNLAIEPFFVNQWTTGNFQIKSDEFNYNKELSCSNAGFGVFVTELFQDATLNLKWFKTSNDSLFEAKYSGFNPSYFWSIGYTYRTFNLGYSEGKIQTSIKGPIFEAGVIF